MQLDLLYQFVRIRLFPRGRPLLRHPLRKGDTCFHLCYRKWPRLSQQIFLHFLFVSRDFCEIPRIFSTLGLSKGFVGYGHGLDSGCS